MARKPLRELYACGARRIRYAPRAASRFRGCIKIIISIQAECSLLRSLKLSGGAVRFSS